MMKLSRQYLNELHSKFGYYANWLPGTPLSIGDVGIIEKNQYHHRTSLAHLGISFETKKDNGVENFMEYTSSQGVDITFKLSGEAPMVGSSFETGDSGITLKFKRGESTFFRLKEIKTDMIDNIPDLEREIRNRSKSGNWKKDYVIISEVKKASSGTILLSNSADSSIELKATGSVNVSTLDLAAIDSGLSISKSSDMGLKIVTQQELTPLFKGLILKKSTLKKDSELRERGIQNSDVECPFLKLEEINPVPNDTLDIIS